MVTPMLLPWDGKPDRSSASPDWRTTRPTEDLEWRFERSHLGLDVRSDLTDSIQFLADLIKIVLAGLDSGFKRPNVGLTC